MKIKNCPEIGLTQSSAMLPIIAFALLPQVLALTKIDSLPILVNFKPLDKGLTLVDRDRARIQTLLGRHKKRAKTKSVGLKNTGAEYTIKVGFGSPPTYWEDNLLIDTGSAYTWINADRGYIKTETSIKQEGQEFFADYLWGFAFGAHYKDLVTLSPTLSIANMPFGVASFTDLEGIDGILGLGPASLSQGVLKPNNNELVPTIMDALVAQNQIRHNIFGLSFAPFTSQGKVDGRLSFGAVNRRKWTGKLNWVNTTKKKLQNECWGFEQTIKVMGGQCSAEQQQQLTTTQYGKRVIQPPSAGIVDSGTALIFIAPQAFEAYSKSIPGSKIDKLSKLLEIPKDRVSEMKSLYFVIGGVSFYFAVKKKHLKATQVSYELIPRAQLLPRVLNTQVVLLQLPCTMIPLAFSEPEDLVKPLTTRMAPLKREPSYSMINHTTARRYCRSKKLVSFRSLRQGHVGGARRTSGFLIRAKYPRGTTVAPTRIVTAPRYCDHPSCIPLSYDPHNTVPRSLDSFSAAPYYRQATPTLGPLSGIRLDRHHEPGRWLTANSRIQTDD
ncbi:unnamed protein product [Rhizoctonia solani]|uniref:Peptidase A1 domain-containing protein n=1 Tax=Rhizoctonia solani TaxID=456999 RepID=A0A8H3DY98_9AGAM|nr:unnamed protein product [Rhizoctonia solani]